LKKLLESIASLLKVKTIVTLSVIFVFVVLSLRGDVPPEKVMLIVGTVIAFYFGTVYEKNGGDKK